jgi:diaminopimelate decarboxylase
VFLSEAVEINDANHLEMAGVDLVETAKQYGTPLYVYNETLIRRKCRAYRKALAKSYPAGEVAYAGKAFLNMALCRLMDQEGLSLDVVSAGELYLAGQAAFPMRRVYFHGNNKSAAELAMALEMGVGRIVVDNLAELEQLDRETRRLRKKAAVLLRVKPGVSGHTHHHIQTGQVDSKFGLDIESGQFLSAVKRCLRAPGLDLRGLHCHIGSQILDPRPFYLAAEIMVSLLAVIRRETGVALPELNLGGGLGICYTREDRCCSAADFVQELSRTVREKAQTHDLPLPKMILEPGRSIVGEAGVTLYTVGTVKDVPGVRRYLAVDGGMTDNLRSALYGARYEAVLANRVQGEPPETVTVAGKACESGDILIRDIALPPARAGDILAVFNTGAYHFSMFSHYNRHLRPAVVFLRRGRAELVSRRETFADLARLERVPPHLERAGAAQKRKSLILKRSGLS